MSARNLVLAAYRDLLRARRLAFQGDVHALQVSAQRARDEFNKHRGEVDATKVATLLDHAAQAAKVLRTQIVQGVREDQNSATFRLHVDKSRHRLHDSPKAKRI